MLGFIKLYLWRACNQTGGLEIGSLQALSKTHLRQQLRQQQLTLLHARCRYYPSHRIDQQQLMHTLTLLSKQLHAGIALKPALEHVIAQITHPVITQLLNRILNRVLNGCALSAALQADQYHFSTLLITLLRAGEHAGTLPNMLHTYLQLYGQQQVTRKQLISSIRYPLFLLATAIVTTGIMLVFVVPQFAALFNNAGKSLPMLTATIITASDILREHSIALLASLLTIAMAVKYYGAKLFIHTPMLRHLYAMQYWGRWCYVLGMLLDNGVDLNTALSQAKHLLPMHFHQTHDRFTEQLQQGIPLAQIWQQYTHFNRAHVGILSTLSQQGQLSSALLQVADHIHIDLQEKYQSFSRRLSPLLLFFIAGLTGVMVIALYLPIFQLGSLM